MYLLLKAALSGLVVAIASETARRSSLVSAIIISLPLTSILALIWLYRDTGENRDVADLCWSILWVIVPSLVFFVVMPLALRTLSFWPSLVLACAATGAAYALWVWTAKRIGIDL